MVVKETPARDFRVGLMRSLKTQAQSCAKRTCPSRFLLAVFNIITVDVTSWPPDERRFLAIS